ncbi:uncharacterized protein LOC105427819 [Pogonomyrmex barbatus]|uniref:Uncharacterized protein LOC105427819 n=1 Tax=Pogonomyrmex barbatus TaxID=144034 RepID=A0A6I9WFR6_9HYME|nr:uncharacterized protein LOC105427819 [Pogonomyrmex barbatus]
MTVKKRRLVEELHAPARRNFPRRRVVVCYNDLWQADVVEMRPYARRNKGYNYVMTIIDVLSKYAWIVPLKSKRKRGSRGVIQDISRRRSTSAKSTNGQGYDIRHYSTYSVMKAAVVERFNRTLKNNMCKLFTLNGSYRA